LAREFWENNPVEYEPVRHQPSHSQLNFNAGSTEREERQGVHSLSTLPQDASVVREPQNAPVRPKLRAITAMALSYTAKKWSVEQKTMGMLGLASIILLALNLLFYWSFTKQKETSNQVNHSQQILRKLETVLSSVKDAETGQRGYLLTGRESYLEPHNLAVKTMPQQIVALKRLTAAEPAQQQQLSLLEPLIAKKFAELQGTIDLRKSRGFDAAAQVVLTNQGKELMDQIRTTIQQMQSKQSEQLQTWLKAKEAQSDQLQLTFLGGILLTLFAFYLVYRAVQQETRERKQAEASYQKLNEQLEARVQERTAALKEANASLAYSNRELEQFAYVASHDLQEPLRAVNSYAQLIARKYQGNLDAKADKYIGYIMEGATRMQQLINDLLEFSRIGTRSKALKLTACEAVLNQVAENLRIAIAEHQAIITHDPLPTVMGDETQLIQLLQNLIGNAIKFRREEPPQVHVSAQQGQREWVFSIHDNGIGMESEYFDRIFTIFQRLHSRAEYPGTGIGLAVCKKIVERHGGRIWVESESGVGTTFYFTIPCLRQ
jgi:signal transduction histidine kinase